MSFYLTKDLERLTGVSWGRIAYAIVRRRLPEPQKIAGNKVWTEKDLIRIRDHFSGRKPWQRIATNKIDNSERTGKE